MIRWLSSLILGSWGAGGIALVLAMASGLSAADVGTAVNTPPAVVAQTQIYSSRVKPFLEAHCVECHGDEVAKSGLRLDTLPADFTTPEHLRIWNKVLDRVEAGEMPPKKSARPPAAEQQEVLGWIGAQLLEADQRQQGESQYRMRRMTRLQYENTIHDLLGINTELQSGLPEDSRSLGFDNVGDAQTLSPAQIEAYLDAADAALDAAIVHAPRPQTIKRRYLGRDALGYPSNKFEGAVRDLGDAAVLFSHASFSFPDVSEGSFTALTEGRYRVRVSMYAYQSNGEAIEVYAYSGPPIGEHPIGYFSALPGAPRVLDFTCHLDKGDHVTFACNRQAYTQRTRNPELCKAPGLAVQWVEIEGPIIDTWPPQSHRALFGDLPLRPRAEKGPRASVLTVECAHPAEESRRLITAFQRRAYRRPVTQEEAQPFIDLVAQEYASSKDFEDAMRVGYKTILCSPGFLFFKEKRNEPNEFALASRLSYFLWNTMPDDELLGLAERGELSKPRHLDEQVERLLNDPRAQAFVQNFTSQWLDLRLLDFTTPDKKLYPEYNLSNDGLLRQSIEQETKMFFAEVLKQDLSVTNFVDSNFSFLNDRLAKHYGISGVEGPEMRKVALLPGCHRGGVITQASVLKVTANGTTTSPVVRGVWVLRNIVGKNPDPPPPNAGAIEPDVRGAKTIREQLEKHRRVASCTSCHVKIDPLGFALENFDVMGGWQDNYRILSGPNLAMSRKGPKVETTSGLSLPNGAVVTNLDELKSYLLSDKDQLARCLAEKLLIYSTGRGLHFSDRAAVKKIISHVREKNYGLRALVHEVVQSDVFLNE